MLENSSIAQPTRPYQSWFVSLWPLFAFCHSSLSKRPFFGLYLTFWFLFARCGCCWSCQNPRPACLVDKMRSGDVGRTVSSTWCQWWYNSCRSLEEMATSIGHILDCSADPPSPVIYGGLCTQTWTLWYLSSFIYFSFQSNTKHTVRTAGLSIQAFLRNMAHWEQTSVLCVFLWIRTV